MLSTLEDETIEDCMMVSDTDNTPPTSHAISPTHIR